MLPGGTLTNSKIEDVLDMLSDGKWHMLMEIRERAKVDEEQIKQIIDFLKEYDFIAWDEREKRVRLKKMAQQFLAQKTSA
jgi:DNA-binding IclR family transcriptional regulator